MNIMGLEEPVMMPSMEVYNTDLMKEYIAGVKEQYDTAKLDVKDFMKQYGDFYSPINGATEKYNALTVGGARDLINNFYANGIDPFKSPEARAAIYKYIQSVPTGELNSMKRQAEAAMEYKKNRDKAIANNLYDPDFERFMLGGQTLEEWDGTKGEWTATSPYTKQTWDEYVKPYFSKFEAQEYLGPSSREGYMLLGTKPLEIANASNSVYDDLANSPWGRYQIDKAQRAAGGVTNTDGTLLTLKQKQLFVEQYVKGQINDAATQYFQPKEVEDRVAMDNIRTNNDIRAHSKNAATDHYYWKLQHPDKDPSNSNSDSDKSDDVYPLGTSAIRNIDSILDNYQPKETKDGKFMSAFLLGQTERVKNAVKGGYSADKVLDSLSGADDAGGFSSWLNRNQAYNKDAHTVYLDKDVDINRLYSANEIIYRSGIMAKGVSPVARYVTSAGEYGNNLRKKIRSGGSNVPMKDLGKVTTIRFADGTVHVYKPVYIEGVGKMYYDTTYEFADSYNGVIENTNKTAGARQMDVRRGRSQYGLRQPQNVGKL